MPTGQVVDIVGKGDIDPTRLVIADEEGLSTVSLAPGHELGYRLGERHCAGTFVNDHHLPCDRPETPYCPDHDSTWICARCRGTCLKDEMDCYEEHVLYLACFAPTTLKVGVTKRDRLDRRLREQGADRGAIIDFFENGRLVRKREAELATQIPDRIGIETKLAGVHRSVDETAWEQALETYNASQPRRLEYGIELEDRPVEATIATGRVLGTKGRLLLLERGETAYAVDCRNLLGVTLETGRPQDSRQPSLAEFGQID